MRKLNEYEMGQWASIFGAGETMDTAQVSEFSPVELRPVDMTGLQNAARKNKEDRDKKKPDTNSVRTSALTPDTAKTSVAGPNDGKDMSNAPGLSGRAAQRNAELDTEAPPMLPGQAESRAQQFMEETDELYNLKRRR